MSPDLLFYHPKSFDKGAFEVAEILDLKWGFEGKIEAILVANLSGQKKAFIFLKSVCEVKNNPLSLPSANGSEYQHELLALEYAKMFEFRSEMRTFATPFKKCPRHMFIESSSC